MVQYCDFDMQVTRARENTSIRPDMTINLPSNRQLVVDSKVPLDSYLTSLEVQDESTRNDLIKKHAKAIKEHSRLLSSKEYWKQFPKAPEFVIRFIPRETFLYPALEVDKNLLEDGIKENVIISTPTTLISFLKAVAREWSEKAMEENALKIAKLGKELFERLWKMGGSVGALGKKIGNSVDSYNKLVGTFENRVLVSARRFGELGVGDGSSLDSLEFIDKIPKEPLHEEDR